jgi:2-succinyl-5-enolpyruvyl-6-hydroxy-3-cyclohexene-1-carboxylate synthase
MSATAAEALAHAVLTRLLAAGVREFCVCPGARNAPFIAWLAGPERDPAITCRYFYEERSAAFYALGRARRLQAPVAVLTTSGTAAGELLPATMEAYYTGVPLVLVTSDRPRSYRHTGAPQVAMQPGIFGIYVSESLDLDHSVPALKISALPLHLNVCFDEPLVSAAAERALHPDARLATPSVSNAAPSTGPAPDLAGFFAQAARPLALVSGLGSAAEREGVASFLLAHGIPAYLEAASGLREDPRLAQLRVHQGDRLIERAVQAEYAIDGVLRIGAVPTHRLWRDLEGKLAHLPVVSVSALPFSGLSRDNRLIQCSPARLAEVPAAGTPPREWAQRFLAADREFQAGIDALCAEHPRAEPALFRALSRVIAPSSHVYVGNSLPIREWDLAATFEPRGLELTASRGLNGIDGQVSTFLGLSETGRENWAIVGDLTALYDLAGPWALRDRPELDARICVVNNGGGRIFDRMFPEKEFQNAHPIRFRAWADLWGLPFEQWETVPAARPLAGASLVELVPCAESTRAFWEAYAKL